MPFQDFSQEMSARQRRENLPAAGDADVRNTTPFPFKTAGAPLLDFLHAQREYRDTQLAYLNLIGAYLTAAAQRNMAVGQEVIQ
jgi:hypothetical protein